MAKGNIEVKINADSEVIEAIRKRFEDNETHIMDIRKETSKEIDSVLKRVNHLNILNNDYMNEVTKGIHLQGELLISHDGLIKKLLYISEKQNEMISNLLSMIELAVSNDD